MGRGMQRKSMQLTGPKDWQDGTFHGGRWPLSTLHTGTHLTHAHDIYKVQMQLHRV